MRLFWRDFKIAIILAVAAYGCFATFVLTNSFRHLVSF